MNLKLLFFIRKVFLLLISVILLLGVVVQTVIALMYNISLSKNYSHNTEAYNYKEAITEGNIDVKEMERLFPSAETLVGYNLTNVISAPVTIRYYYAIGDQSPAYVIDKGERIHVRKDSNSLSVKVGYGLDSMPTDVDGWRIAYSFATDSAGMSNELLFVRMDQLFDVARSWVTANESLVKVARSRVIAEESLFKRVYQRMWLTRNNTIRRFTLVVDHKLYDRGVYLSSDLFVPVFPVYSLIMSALAVFAATAWIFLSAARK